MIISRGNLYCNPELEISKKTISTVNSPELPFLCFFSFLCYIIILYIASSTIPIFVLHRSSVVSGLTIQELAQLAALPPFSSRFPEHLQDSLENELIGWFSGSYDEQIFFVASPQNPASKFPGHEGDKLLNRSDIEISAKWIHVSYGVYGVCGVCKLGFSACVH